MKIEVTTTARAEGHTQWPQPIHPPTCQSSQRSVVGYDGSEPSRDALWWAVQEVQQRRERGSEKAHVHVLYAQHHEARFSEEGLKSDLEKVLPTGTAGLVHPFTLSGDIPGVLVAASHGAALLVMGTDIALGHSPRFGHRVLGSDSTRASAYATCPVAVIHTAQVWSRARSGRPRPPGGDASGPPELRVADPGELAPDPDAPRIVAVGVEDTFSSRDAVRWAVQEARLRGCRLLVMHSNPQRAGDPASPVELELSWSGATAVLRPQQPPAAGPDEDRAFVEQLLTSARADDATEAAFEEVETTVQVRGEDVREALTLSAQEAELLVIGSSRHGIPRLLRPGHTADVLHRIWDVRPGETDEQIGHRTCPVVVTPAADEDKHDHTRIALGVLEKAWLAHLQAEAGDLDPPEYR
jgi:nucleotide-binding universal stress UspA family protein